MVHLQLRPDLPLCWESPDSLRIGFEHAAARVPHPSAAQQRLLGRLRDGFPAEALAAQTRAVGATPREAREVLALVEPALIQNRDHRELNRTAPVSVLLSDGGRPVPGFREALLSSGVCAIDDDPVTPELVVYVERFLEPLERARAWLSADVPQLLVRFTDTRVVVGPLVLPPGAPCHTCATLAALARDPALPVLAAQLVGVRPASETRVLGAAVATAAACILAEWRAGSSAGARDQLEIPVREGRPAGAASVTTIAAHPECACGTLLGDARAPERAAASALAAGAPEAEGPRQAGGSDETGFSDEA